jgi:hypothetical protein
MKIRLFAPWCTEDIEFETGKFIFSGRVTLEEADAMLVSWQPVDDMYKFHGPKAFFCPEPFDVPSVWQQPEWQKAIRLLDKDDIVRPGHSNPLRRVVHDTHHVELNMRTGSDRLRQGVAVVSNNGSQWNAYWDEIKLRNALITNRQVDLFGDHTAWSRYRRNWLMRKTTPRNYRGEIRGNWTNDDLLDILEKYRVAVCLENSCEPYYFTEKMLNAVRAGCIPVYHAHPTVAAGILKDAKWVDPKDHGFDPERTLKFALDQDLREFQETNEKWLLSDAVAATESSRIRVQIAEILESQLQSPGKTGAASCDSESTE